MTRNGRDVGCDETPHPRHNGENRICLSSQAQLNIVIRITPSPFKSVGTTKMNAKTLIAGTSIALALAAGCRNAGQRRDHDVRVV